MITKNNCYKCNVSIDFTSKEAITPSGKPTKDPLTGKAIPLDPSTHEYHACRPEDISAYRETDKYKRTVTEWKNRQQQKEKENFGSTDSNGVPSCNDATNKNNDNSSTNLDLEILNSISHTEQMQIDCKADMAAISKDITAIKIALKIGTDRSSSSDSDEKQIGG